jgi:hypothetical protein
VEVRHEVVLVLDADRDAHEVPRHLQGRALGGEMRHGRRVLDEGLDPAQRLGEREQLRGLDEHAGRALAAGEADGDHAAEAGHLGLRDLVARVRGQPRVDDLRDQVAGLERRADGERVLLVPVHAHRQGLQTARDEPTVEGREARADRVDEVVDRLRVCLVREDDRPADDVRVPAEELRQRVDDDVGAEADRLLQVGRGERVVDDQERVGLVRDGGDLGDVHDLEERVRRGLDPHEVGRLPRDGRADGVGVGEVDGVDRDAPRAEDARDEAVRARVGVVAEEDVGARTQERAQHDVLGLHAGGHRVGHGAALEAGERVLQAGAGRVARAGVLVPRTELPDGVVAERRGEVEGAADGPGCGVGLLTLVDRPGGEVRHR